MKTSRSLPPYLGQGRGSVLPPASHQDPVRTLQSPRSRRGAQIGLEPPLHGDPARQNPRPALSAEPPPRFTGSCRSVLSRNSLGAAVPFPPRFTGSRSRPAPVLPSPAPGGGCGGLSPAPGQRVPGTDTHPTPRTPIQHPLPAPTPAEAQHQPQTARSPGQLPALAVQLCQAPHSVPVCFISTHASAMDTSLSPPHCHGHARLPLGAGCRGPSKQLHLELNCQWHWLGLLILLHFSSVFVFSFSCGKKYIYHCLERVNDPKSSSVQGCQR